MAEWKIDSGLSVDQHAFAHDVLGADATLIADMSWGQVDTRVLHVSSGGSDFVVKAAGAGNHHILREITAHETATAPLLALERCSKLVAADRERNVLITTFAPGALVLGTTAEHEPEIYTQAGELLRKFHDQSVRIDAAYESRATAKAIAWLDREHRIPRDIEERTRAILGNYSPRPITVAPTHGDWQPRNWVYDGSTLRVIDFGRFDYRPPATDLCRLAVQQWRTTPGLEEAFLAGYGSDPRDPEVWSIDLLREAIGTAVWAYLVGDEPFEQQGQRMLIDAISLFE